MADTPSQYSSSIKRFALPLLWLAIALFTCATVVAVWTGAIPLFAQGERITINDLKHLRTGETAQINGVVTFADSQTRVVFLQDATAGMRIELDGNSKFPRVADEVRVTGIVAGESSKSDVQVGSNSVHLKNIQLAVSGRSKLPDPQQSSLFEQFASGGLKDSTRVHTAGAVRGFTQSEKQLIVEIADSGRTMFVTILDAGNLDPSSLIDARVALKGTLQLGYVEPIKSRPDGDNSPVPHLWTPDIEDLQVLSPPSAQIALVPSVWSLISNPQWTNRGSRVRIRGTLVREHARNERIVQIQSGGIFMPVECDTAIDLPNGTVVEVTGWPNHTRF